MEIRLATAEDREAIQWLWGYCFDRKEPFFSWYFSECFRPEHAVVCRDGRQLTGSAQLTPYRIFLRGRAAEVTYIVGVAVLPEARRKGLAQAMLRMGLEEARRRGHSACILQPFQTRFYRRMQWEVCYHHLTYQMPLAALAECAPPVGEWRRLAGAGESPGLDEVYRAFVAGRHGYALRSQKGWRDLLVDHFGDGGHACLLESDGRPEGYLLYALEGDAVRVRELAAARPSATQALLGYLYSHRSQASRLEWSAPADELSHLYLPDEGLRVSLAPFMMARVVDVQRALREACVPPEVAGGLRLRILDELAPWNDRTLLVEAQGGTLTARETEEPEEVRCPVGAFTQLYFGAVSAQALWRIGRLAPGGSRGPEALSLLDRLFPPAANYINELF